MLLRNRFQTSNILSPDCKRPSLTAAPRGKIFFTNMGPGPCTEESLVTTVKPSPSGPKPQREKNCESEINRRKYIIKRIYVKGQTFRSK